jgi:hypothetical protein
MKKLIFVLLLLLTQTVLHAQDDTTYQGYDTVEVTTSSDASYDEQPAEQPTSNVVTFRTVPDSIVENLKRDKEFEYANDPDFWNEERARVNNELLGDRNPTWLDKLFSQIWFRRTLLALMVCLLVFAVVKIALSNRLMMRRAPKKFNMADDAEALHKDDIDKQVQQAEQEGNFRLAVRYQYMKILQQMDARGMIQLDAKSTNWDYVNRMNNHPLKKQFLLLTRAYEYVWYGEFPLNGEQYQYIKTEFGQYNNSLT